MQALQWAAFELKQKGVESPRLDAEILLAYCLNTERASLYRDASRGLEKAPLEHFQHCIARRAKREPVAYITGVKEFRSMAFKITRDVLIPRPETETMVDEVIKESLELRIRNDALRILEVGTGSGIIAVSLAKEINCLRVIAADCTYAIISLARANAQLQRVDHKILFFVGELCESLKVRDASQLFDVILCNPPYLSDIEWQQAQPEIRDYEPERALRAGPDGLALYRALLPAAGHLLRNGGSIMLEIGQGQAVSISRLIDQTALFHPVATVNDLAGIKRLIKAQKR